MKRNFKLVVVAAGCFAAIVSSTSAFEGRIAAEVVRGTETTALLYAVGSEHLRIEVTGSDWPHPVNIVELKSGAVTLLFPHNRSFVRLENRGAQAPSPPGIAGLPALPIPPGIGPQPSFPTRGPVAQPPAASLPGAPAIPNVPTPVAGLPPGVGPQPPAVGPAPALPNLPALPPGLPPGIGPQPPATGTTPTLPNLPALPAGLPPGIGPQPPGAGAVPAIPRMPAMPMIPMPGEKLELTLTKDTRDILGFPCTRYELKQRGQTLEVWATEKLLPFQQYLRDQPHRFGPRMLEEQWPEMLQSRKLFPLRVTLCFDNGNETFRFEVKSVTPEKIADEKQLAPPTGYHELRPLPF
jgi:hypothetical protein